MTPRRFRKLQSVLDSRQPDLTVLLDNVHKTHNFSAILRSCDAVGVFEAHAVWPDAKLRPNHMTSGGAAKWVRIVTHADTETALRHLREHAFQLVAAHPGREAHDYRDVDYTRATALMFGAGLSGLSNDALEQAEMQISVPMMGMVKSLNVSVAAATILFEAQRQRMSKGMYAESRLETELYRRTLFEWAHPEVAECCRSHGREYPELSDEGEIIGHL